MIEFEFTKRFIALLKAEQDSYDGDFTDRDITTTFTDTPHKVASFEYPKGMGFELRKRIEYFVDDLYTYYKLAGIKEIKVSKMGVKHYEGLLHFKSLPDANDLEEIRFLYQDKLEKYKQFISFFIVVNNKIYRDKVIS
jgi:hypothetical protein